MGAQHSVSVAAVVVNEDGQILVVQRRDNGHWEPPGGVLELDESIKECVKREVREESGYEIEPDELTGVYKNMTRNVVALVFRAHLIGGTPRASDETTRIEWWEPKRAMAQMDESYAVRISDALASNSTSIRAHDGIHLIQRQ